MGIENIVQIIASALISLVVGAASAWFAGWLGVSHGLKRAQHERSFDRQLEWHEDTIRSLNRFGDSVMRLVNAFSAHNDDAIPSFLTKLDETATELSSLIGESVLYAEARVVRQLRDGLAKLNDLRADISESRDFVTGSAATVVEHAVDLDGYLRQLAWSLSCNVRKRLNLDDISTDDFRSSNPIP